MSAQRTSALRGFLVSGLFVYIFPSLLGADSIWFVMAAAELATALGAVFLIKKTAK